MASIKLPEVPTGEYLEDHVASVLQCSGFYTEKSLIESGETQVMELDVMAWKPDQQLPQHTLFEVKGGSWGFPDIFKVYGWKTYLQSRHVGSAYMIAPELKRSEKTIEYMKDKCSDIGIQLITYNDPQSLEENLKDAGLVPPGTDPLDLMLWRFSFWLERKMQHVVANSRKSQKSNKGPAAIYRYQELIRNGFLQARDVRERLSSLYEAHFNHRLLAKSVAAELDGKSWNSETPGDGQHWRGALYHCRHPLVQAAMYYGHRARLDILKGAVEFALLDIHDALPPERNIDFLGSKISADFLPSNFHTTVSALQNIDQFEKIPILWQSFLWKWGGFFLTDREDEEKLALAAEVNMGAQYVDSALKVYETLFPLEGGWFYDANGTNIIKLFPCPFRGIGLRLRSEQMGTSDPTIAFKSAQYKYFLTNAIKWNNATFDLLRFESSS